MGKGFLIDTNAVIDFTMRVLPPKGPRFMVEVLDDQPSISVIVAIELLGFPAVEESIVEFVDRSDVLQLDDVVVEKTIFLRKKHRVKLPDAIIAATAIAHNLTLITRNTKDFQKVKGLKMVNPYDL